MSPQPGKQETGQDSIYKRDQREHMEEAATDLDLALDHLMEPWMPYGWQEAARSLRDRIVRELER